MECGSRIEDQLGVAVKLGDEEEVVGVPLYDTSCSPPPSSSPCPQRCKGPENPARCGEATWQGARRRRAPLRERGGAGGRARERGKLCPLFGDRARHPEALLRPTVGSRDRRSSLLGRTVDLTQDRSPSLASFSCLHAWPLAQEAVHGRGGHRGGALPGCQLSPHRTAVPVRPPGWEFVQKPLGAVNPRSRGRSDELRR